MLTGCGCSRPDRCVHIKGRVVMAGTAIGQALVSTEPMGFLGGVDPETGIVIEANHPLHGLSVVQYVLVFPTGKGSTVGSYTLYQMAQNNVAPAAIINTEADPVVAIGAIISDIPMVDQVDLSRIRTGDWIEIIEDDIWICPLLKQDQQTRHHHNRAGPKGQSPGKTNVDKEKSEKRKSSPHRNGRESSF